MYTHDMYLSYPSLSFTICKQMLKLKGKECRAELTADNWCLPFRECPSGLRERSVARLRAARRLVRLCSSESCPQASSVMLL